MIRSILCALLVSPMFAIAAAPPGKAPTTSVTSDAAGLVADVTKAYTALKGLQLAGKLTGDFDVDGNQQSNQETFTSFFTAPAKFRHAQSDGLMLGSTGRRLFGFFKSRNLYKLSDAPTSKVTSDEMPEPFGQLLFEQNPSLLLALLRNPTTELVELYKNIDKAPDVTISNKNYPALLLTNQQGEPATTMAFDPDTHLLRRVQTDLSSMLKERGAQNVKKATVTIDYLTTTPDVDIQPERFAWAPPAGARDLDTLQEDPGGEAASALEGKPAPARKLRDLDGNEVKLADLKGQVVVLDFWATWCGPCVMSLPELDKLATEKKDQAKFFAVNQGEDKDLVQGFMKSKNLSIPVLLDPDMAVGLQYKADSAIPLTIVIGKDGVVRKVFKGVGPNTHTQLREAVDAAVKGPK